MNIEYDKYQRNGAYHYQWYSDPNWAWYKECVDRVVDFCQGSTIDIGSGDGLIASKLKEKGFVCLGIDNDPTAIRLAADRGCPTLEWDLNFSGNPSIHGEFVCSLNTIEHLKNPFSLQEYVATASKGAIIITDKATDLKGRYHEHEYTKDELLDVFKEFKPKYFEINSTEFGKPITFIGVEIRK